MANIKSSQKRALLEKKAQARNRSARSLMKTNMKKFDAAVQSGDKDAAQEAYKNAVKIVDRAATRGLIHKNKAARRKRSLTLKLSSM